MTSDESLSDLSDRLIDGDLYLAELDDDSRDELVALLNARHYGHAGAHDLFGLVLVLFGIRPACLVSRSRPALSADLAADMAADHASLARCDLVGQFLDSYDIPYAFVNKHSDGWPDEPAGVHLNYHVSLDQDRIDTYLEQRPEYDRDTGLSAAADQALGRFLGYPTPAIEAYCADEQMEQGQLLDTISDEELRRALGPVAELYDVLDLDHREFTRLLIPYVVASTVPECLDRVVHDALQYLAGGVLAAHEYHITLFDQVITDYRERFAPDS